MKGSRLIRVDNEFYDLLQKIKNDLKNDTGLNISDREASKVFMKKYRKKKGFIL